MRTLVIDNGLVWATGEADAFDAFRAAWPDHEVVLWDGPQPTPPDGGGYPPDPRTASQVLEDRRAVKLAEVEAWKDATFGAGFQVAVPGSDPAVTLTLAGGDNDRDLFNGQASSIREGITQNAAQPDGTNEIYDVTGARYTLANQQILLTLLAYSALYKAALDLYVGYKRGALTAQNLADLALVTPA